MKRISKTPNFKIPYFFLVLFIISISCKDKNSKNPGQLNTKDTISEPAVGAKDNLPDFVSEPLVSDNYTADPSAHVFLDRIYIYPSHDYDSGIPQDALGSHFNMKDYHIYSMDDLGSPVKDYGVVLDVKNVPWAEKQMWAPDAATKNGKYYLYFPAKDKDGIFKIGVALGDDPAGPFKARPKPIKGSYSIDPAVFADSDGKFYMYFGGIWGGQLQRWSSGKYSDKDVYPTDSEPALGPKIAKLKGDMLEFSETPKDIVILGKDGKPLTAGENEKRFFEAAWMHKYMDKYYFSYSTGDTHKIVYATGDNPYGPFTYQGVVLEPVLGWTSHHSIVEFKGNWYLFYHDSSLSKGKTHLRSIKMAKLEYDGDRRIKTVSAFVEKNK